MLTTKTHYIKSILIQEWQLQILVAKHDILINTLFTLTCVLYNHRILRNFVYKANNRSGGLEESVLAQFFQVRLRLSLACFHLFLFVYKHNYIAD